MMFRLSAYGLAMMLTGIPVQSSAQLIELGRGVDIQEISFAMGELSERLIDPDQLNINKPSNMASPVPPNTVQAARMINEGIVNPQFPLRTDLRYSDSSTVFEVDVLLQSPLCIVGADEGSIAWLQKNKQRLSELNALCVVAAADSQGEVDYLQELAKPVPVITMPIDEIARLHNIRHYPVLVMGKGSFKRSQ